MKALVLVEYNRLEIEDVPIPQVGPQDLLLKVAACGICGSDVHGMDGSTGRRRPPVIMGHEAAGVVVQIGSDVQGWTEGDRATFDSTLSCGACTFCRTGHSNLCENRLVLGVSCEEYRCNGAFAEYVVVPQHVAYLLPEEVDFLQAAMVEPLSVAVHAVSRMNVNLDDTAVVVGTGTIGLLVVQVLRATGCGSILAVDLDPNRLELACQLGATEAISADTSDVLAEIVRRTGGLGADLAVEVVGKELTVALAVDCLRKGGQLALVGNLSPKVGVPLQSIVARELTLYGSCASNGEYPACLNLMGQEMIDVRPLISATAPLEEGAVWFERLRTGEKGLLKVMLEPFA